MSGFFCYLQIDPPRYCTPKGWFGFKCIYLCFNSVNFALFHVPVCVPIIPYYGQLAGLIFACFDFPKWISCCKKDVAVSSLRFYVQLLEWTWAKLIVFMDGLFGLDRAWENKLGKALLFTVGFLSYNKLGYALTTGVKLSVGASFALRP